MGVFGTDDDVDTFPLAEGSLDPRFLSLRRHREVFGHQADDAKQSSTSRPAMQLRRQTEPAKDADKIRN